MKTYIVVIVVYFAQVAGCTNNAHLENEKTIEYIPITYPVKVDVVNQNEFGYPEMKSFLDSYEETVKRYAYRYGFDWRLIIALVNQESRFQERAVSSVGAYGLMQIMPATGRDITAQLFIDNVIDPQYNIAGGVYYLWRLHIMFAPEEENPDSPDNYRGGFAPSKLDQLQLALAAYNGGPTRVRDAQAIARYLNLDPYRWAIIRSILPMLTERYYMLHTYVWENGKPEGGYFYGYEETINYVEGVLRYYSYYEHVLK